MTSSWARGVLRGDDTPAATLVVKLGGSLLASADWPRAVAALLDTLPAPRLIVTGGGPVVDGLRTIDDAWQLPADLTHALAISCMGHTARIVATALSVPITDAPEPGGPTTAVLDTPAWLSRERRLEGLPVGWHVTSDSIAATVATACGGGLLLVKSAAPSEDDLGRLATVGWVDAFFPAAAQRVSWIGWAAPARHRTP